MEVTLANGDVVSVETVDQLRDIRRTCRKRRVRGFVINHCVDLIYPVTISFPDGSEETFDNQDDHFEALKEWRDNNEGAGERPKLVFPQDVELPDETVVTVQNAEEFKALIMQCVEDRPLGPCYKIVFPVTIDFPDETSADVADPESLKEAVQAWKEANPDAADRPEISFPYDVELPNGSIVTLENGEDAKRLLATCKVRRDLPSLINNECFHINFPVAFKTSFNDTMMVASLEDLKELIESNKGRRKHHKLKNYPRIILPFDVTLKEDGTTVTIENFEDLKEIFEGCRD